MPDRWMNVKGKKVLVRSSPMPVQATKPDPAKPLPAAKTTLTTLEHTTIREYTAEKFLDVNSSLRDGSWEGDPQKRTIVQRLDQALSRLPNHDGIVYRTIDLPAGSDLTKTFAPGKVVQDAAYMSTTPNVNNNRGVHGGASQVQLVIKNSGGKDISSVANDQEVIIPRERKFKITKVNPTELGGLVVEMEGVD